LLARSLRLAAAALAAFAHSYAARACPGPCWPAGASCLPCCARQQVAPLPGRPSTKLRLSTDNKPEPDVEPESGSRHLDAAPAWRPARFACPPPHLNTPIEGHFELFSPPRLRRVTGTADFQTPGGGWRPSRRRAKSVRPAPDHGSDKPSQSDRSLCPAPAGAPFLPLPALLPHDGTRALTSGRKAGGRPSCSMNRRSPLLPLSGSLPGWPSSPPLVALPIPVKASIPS